MWTGIVHFPYDLTSGWVFAILCEVHSSYVYDERTPCLLSGLWSKSPLMDSTIHTQRHGRYSGTQVSARRPVGRAELCADTVSTFRQIPRLFIKLGQYNFLSPIHYSWIIMHLMPYDRSYWNVNLWKATNAQGKARGIALRTHNQRARRGGGGQCQALAALPPGKETRCSLHRTLWRTSGLVWTGTENFAITGFQPRTILPVASRYSEYAIPAVAFKRAINTIHT